MSNLETGLQRKTGCHKTADISLSKQNPRVLFISRNKWLSRIVIKAGPEYNLHILLIIGIYEQNVRAMIAAW